MKINKKVPIERQFDGTNNLLMSPIKNKIVNILYTKNTLFSSRRINSFNFVILRGNNTNNETKKGVFINEK